MPSPSKSGLLRKLGLFGVLSVTAILSLPGEGEGDEVVDVVVPARARANKAAATPVRPANRGAIGEQAVLGQDAADPFAIRDWQPAPVAPAAPAPAAQNIATVEVPAAPAVPALPYKYLGRLADGGEEVVYLSRGEESVLARLNDTLEATYKVVAISPQSVEFEHLPSGERQSITTTPVAN